MLAPTVDSAVSTSGASPVTVTVSCEGRRAELQGDRQCLVQQQLETRPGCGLKTRQARRNPVGADTHRDTERALRVRDSLKRVSRFLVHHGNGDSWEHASGRVSDRARDDRLLRVTGRRPRQDCQ